MVLWLRTQLRSRGETAIQQSWEEVIQFFQARGCAGTTEEIKRVVLNRIQGAKILRQAEKVLPTSFRPQLHNLSAPPSGLATAVSGLRRGRERREIKLRRKWRRVEDKSRPSGLTGAAHRRGGSLKRARVDAAAIGTLRVCGSSLSHSKAWCCSQGTMVVGSRGRGAARRRARRGRGAAPSWSRSAAV